MAVMHAFTDTNCEICDKKITTEHIPGNAVCGKCGKENDLCVVCGRSSKTEQARQFVKTVQEPLHIVSNDSTDLSESDDWITPEQHG